MQPVYDELREELRHDLEWSPQLTNEELKDLIERRIFGSKQARRLSTGEKLALAERLFHSFRGLDVLQPLVDDPSITEIMINGAKEVFVERNGITEKSDVVFESEEKLEDLIQAIVGRVNRVVNESSPIVDARLDDGSRVNVVLPPISLNGPAVTIRKFPERPYTLDELTGLGTLPREVADLLKKLVEAKYNMFISGGTGSGKTTLLNALAQYIPKHERVITIEDSAELKITGVENLVSLETRNANTEGKGQITIRDLIRTSLRMRPDRIIVGEVRGPEAYDMLQAMNTGHEGSLSTGHGNTVRDMLDRLETMVLSGMQLPLDAIRRQICSAIDIMIHLSRMRDGSRKVTEIAEIAGMKDGEIRLNTIYRLDERSTPPEEEEGRQSFKARKKEDFGLIRLEKWRKAGLSWNAG